MAGEESRVVSGLRRLQVWLWIVAAVQMSAIAAVMMPRSWMDQCGDWMGVGGMPAGPLSGYLARLSSAMYVVHGMIVGWVAKSLPKTWGMVGPLVWTTVGLGLMMVWVDLIEGMPWVWGTVEAVALFGSAAITWLLARRAT